MTAKRHEAFVIRAAETADLAELGEYGMQLMSLHHEWDQDRFISTGSGTGSSYARWLGAQLEKAGVVILSAERQGAVVGYAYGALEGYDYMALRGPAGVLHDVFVDPQMRQGGIGRALLEAMMDALAKRGAHQIVLSTAQRNEVAQRLFVALGFRPTMIEMTRSFTVPEEPR